MAWHQISVVSKAALSPDISNYFSELGAVSVTYMSATSQPIYEPNIGETKIWEHTKIIALFELNASPDLIKTLLFEQFPDNIIQDWHAEVLEDQIWERSWMEHYKPMKFGEHLWVYPTGQEQFLPGTVSLILGNFSLSTGKY